MRESLGVSRSVLSTLEGQRSSPPIKSQTSAEVRSEPVEGWFWSLSRSYFSTYSPPHEFVPSRHQGRHCDEGNILYLHCPHGHLSLPLAPEPWEGS